MDGYIQSRGDLLISNSDNNGQARKILGKMSKGYIHHFMYLGSSVEDTGRMMTSIRQGVSMNELEEM